MNLRESIHRWLPKVREMAISLPMALLAAIVLVGVNETGQMRSQEAVAQMAHSLETRKAINTLLQSMVDAETGQRGYLLTGNTTYLEPYDKALATVHSSVEGLRQQFRDAPEDMQVFNQLSRQIASKLAEMELSLRLRRQGNEDAWKFILHTDMGKEQMEAIRQHARTLLARSDYNLKQGHEQIEHSLLLSRIGIAIVTAIGLLAFYMYLRQVQAVQRVNQREQTMLEHERDQLERLGKERTATLSELAHHLQQVREEERGHLARELHDELGSLLTAAKLDVARLKSKIDATAPDIAERLRHLTETLNSGIALKRRIIENLRPSSLSNLGLTPALEILGKEFSDSSNVAVELNLEPIAVPESTQLAIYRLIQESLTNIGKYAKASHVQIHLQNYPSHIAIQVRDDGVGFDTNAITPSSHGVAGMRHRIEALGGKLKLQSSAGRGTLVEAVLPQPLVADTANADATAGGA